MEAAQHASTLFIAAAILMAACRRHCLRMRCSRPASCLRAGGSSIDGGESPKAGCPAKMQRQRGAKLGLLQCVSGSRTRPDVGPGRAGAVNFGSAEGPRGRGGGGGGREVAVAGGFPAPAAHVCVFLIAYLHGLLANWSCGARLNYFRP